MPRSNGQIDAMGVIRPYPVAATWIRQAQCRADSPDLFYPPSGGGNRSSTTTARAICADCPVQAECLDYALACEDLDPYGGHGIWAGLTGRERNQIRLNQEQSA